MSETTIVAATPPSSPSQTLPVKVATAAEPNAPTRILPSRPMSTTPERSDHRPARQARINGVPSRMPEAKTTMNALKRSIVLRPSDRRRGGAPRQQHGDRTAEHVLERAREQDHQALDDDDHVAADLGLLERELGAALVENAEQDRGENDAHGVGAPHQRDRNADEAEAGGIFENEPVLLAEDHVDRHAAGERSRQERGDDRHPRRRNAAVDGGGRIGPDGADFVAEPGAPDHHPDRERGGEREQERQVERRDRPMDSERRQEVVELGNLPVDREGRRLGIHLAGLAQNIDQEIAHQGRGDVIEHDRRDDDVAVALGLKVAGNEGERRAEQGGADDRDDDQRIAGQEAEMERRQRRAQARDIGLALDADVEQPGVEADRDRKAGEDETGGVIERESDAFEIAEGAGDENLHRLERILADRQHDETGNDEGRGDIDERDQRDVGPDGQGPQRRAHAATLPGRASPLSSRRSARRTPAPLAGAGWGGGSRELMKKAAFAAELARTPARAQPERNGPPPLPTSPTRGEESAGSLAAFMARAR